MTIRDTDQGSPVIFVNFCSAIDCGERIPNDQHYCQKCAEGIAAQVEYERRRMDRAAGKNFKAVAILVTALVIVGCTCAALAGIAVGWLLDKLTWALGGMF